MAKLELRMSCCIVALLLTAFWAVGEATPSSIGTNSDIEAKKILVLLPSQSPSHAYLMSALTNELLNRGHHITFVTPHPLKSTHPNQREILIRDIFDFRFREHIKNVFTTTMSRLEKVYTLHKRGLVLSRGVFNEPKVLALKNETFDLVITEAFFFQESLLGFAHHFGCPSMALNPVGYHMILNKASGGTINPSYVPCVFGAEIIPETFFDRVFNTVFTVFSMLMYEFYYYPQANALTQEYFPNAPPLYELVTNISLTLVNSNAIFSYPVPLSPTVMEVGGFHIKSRKPLSGYLEKWIRESSEGIVYFSLGANIPTELLPADKLNIILSSLGKLRQRVLLKWNKEIPAGAPANCRFERWVPQQEVLAHPNVRVFVTHGGLLGMQEAAYFGVPIIGMPVFGDQFSNAEIAKEKGFGLSIPFYKLTEHYFDTALNEIINNSRYREHAHKISVLFRSAPVSPLEKAVYYTELLMKLGDFKHLRPSSVNLKWYQYTLIDVVCATGVVLYLIWRITSLLYKKCTGRSKIKSD